MTREHYEQIADALAGFLPPALRSFGWRAHARGLKVWFGDESHEHYEVQLVPRTALTAGGIRGAKAPMLEIGFHAEHPDQARNVAVLDAMPERAWRRALGSEATPGPFIGRQKNWRRLSELWDGEDLETEEAAIEAADRLATYVVTLQRLRDR